jgi:hypothetical protein
MISIASDSTTPSLSALMCDGMGWLSRNDFKRALLLYDRIVYLVPSNTVEFRDIDGRPNYILIPRDFQIVGFDLDHFEPNPVVSDALIQGAKVDASRPGFAAVVASIPQFDRTYTWRITNADADLGRGKSVNLGPDDEVLAHAILLNKFLLAADLVNAVPITGKHYIHALIADKYRAAQSTNAGAGPQVVNPSFGPVAVQVIQAIVADEDLEQHSEIEIIEYKQKHRHLFENFSYAIRKLVKQVSALPENPDFDRQVSELIGT